MAGLQRGVDLEIGGLERLRRLHDGAALDLEAARQLVDLRQKVLRHVLQEARLARQTLDGLDRLAGDVLGGAPHRVDAAHEGRVEVVGALLQRFSERAGMALHGAGERERALAHRLVDGFRAARYRLVDGCGLVLHAAVEAFGDGAHRGLDGLRLGADRFLDLGGVARHGAVERVRAHLEHVGESLRAGRERVFERAEIGARALDDAREADLLVGHAVDDGRDFRADALGQHGQRGKQRVAALRQLLVDEGAGLGGGGGDEAALALDDLGEATRGGRERVGRELARAQDLPRHLSADAAQGIADAVGVVGERRPLALQLLDQAADAVLVLAVGAFQRRHLAVHQRFELACPADGAADGVVDEGDLPANRLSEGGDRLLGHPVGFGQADRDLGHGRRHQLQFLGAPDEKRQEPEQRDRDDNCAGDGHRHRSAEQFEQGLRRLGFGRQHGDAEGHADDEPDGRGDGRDEERLAARLLVQGKDEAADGRHVVVGGELVAGGAGGAALGRSAALAALDRLHDDFGRGFGRPVGGVLLRRWRYWRHGAFARLCTFF